MLFCVVSYKISDVNVKWGGLMSLCFDKILIHLKMNVVVIFHSFIFFSNLVKVLLIYIIIYIYICCAFSKFIIAQKLSHYLPWKCSGK